MTADKPEDFKDSRCKVPNLERALVIMEYLLDHPQGLSIRELTDQLGLVKNSVFRITQTLLGHGYRQEGVARGKLLLGGSMRMRMCTPRFSGVINDPGTMQFFLIQAGHKGINRQEGVTLW